MNYHAPPELQDLLDRWSELTLAEREAIDQAAWDSLESIQGKKAELESRIACASNSLKSSHRIWQSSSDKVRDSLRATFRRLIEAETENRNRLETCMAQSRQAQAESQKAARVLRQVHRRYAAIGPSCWQSYS